MFEAVSGELFYTLFNLLSDQQITRNMVTARLMSARFLREMLKFQDREPFFFGLCVSAGFRQVPCRVKKASSSPTTYTFRKKMALELTHKQFGFYANKALWIGEQLIGVRAAGTTAI